MSDSTQTLKFYIYGDGAIWRVSHKAIKTWVSQHKDGQYLLEMPGVRELKTPRRNYNTNKWSGLPIGIYAPDHTSRLESSWRTSIIVHYDDIEDAIPYWQTLI